MVALAAVLIVAMMTGYMPSYKDESRDECRNIHQVDSCPSEQQPDTEEQFPERYP